MFQSEQDFLKQYNPNEYDRLSLTLDLLVFGISQKETDNYRKLKSKKLSLLLIKRNDYPFKDKWNLPGGFVRIDENLDSAVARLLQRETSLTQLYMEQLCTFGAIDRDPRMRIISTAYLSLINRENLTQTLSKQAQWFDVSWEKKDMEITVFLTGEQINLSFKAIFEEGEYRILEAQEFAFDHALMILTGLLRLKNKINYTDIVFHLMPQYFTLTDLQMVYESILGEKLLAPAFRRIIAEKVTKTDKMLTGAGHRPSCLYQYRFSDSL